MLRRHEIKVDGLDSRPHRPARREDGDILGFDGIFDLFPRASLEHFEATDEEGQIGRPEHRLVYEHLCEGSADAAAWYHTFQVSVPDVDDGSLQADSQEEELGGSLYVDRVFLFDDLLRRQVSGEHHRRDGPDACRAGMIFQNLGARQEHSLHVAKAGITDGGTACVYLCTFPSAAVLVLLAVRAGCAGGVFV